MDKPIQTTVPIYTTNLPQEPGTLEGISRLICEQRWFDVVIASIGAGDNAYTSVTRADKVIEYYKDRFTDTPVTVEGVTQND